MAQVHYSLAMQVDKINILLTQVPIKYFTYITLFVLNVCSKA